MERMQIESIEIRNYRMFKSAVLANLPRLAVLVGENGSGKSTLFDVFFFLKDALAQNVAKSVSRRGGFKELVSRELSGPISIILKFRETGGRLAPEFRKMDGTRRMGMSMPLAESENRSLSFRIFL